MVFAYLMAELSPQQEQPPLRSQVKALTLSQLITMKVFALMALTARFPPLMGRSPLQVQVVQVRVLTMVFAYLMAELSPQQEQPRLMSQVKPVELLTPQAR